MAQLSDQDLQEIIEREMPGYKLVQRPEREADDSVLHPEADEIGPDIETLRKKYLGDEAAAVDAIDEQEDDEAELVVVQPKEATDPFDPSAQPKTVVVSGKDRRIIGSQG